MISPQEMSPFSVVYHSVVGSLLSAVRLAVDPNDQVGFIAACAIGIDKFPSLN